MSKFEYEFSQDRTALTIRVKEDKFDITLAPEFKEEVAASWEESVAAVTVDFSNVEFIDSSGVGALVSVHKRIAPKGGTLKIYKPGPAVISVIELLRLHRVFNLVSE